MVCVSPHFLTVGLEGGGSEGRGDGEGRSGEGV